MYLKMQEQQRNTFLNRDILWRKLEVDNEQQEERSANEDVRLIVLFIFDNFPPKKKGWIMNHICNGGEN